ncbi:delta-60 repeat domain-containing protein [Nocardiopsis gilva]
MVAKTYSRRARGGHGIAPWWRGGTLAVVSAAALVIPAVPVQAAPGDLDTSFGGDGKVTTPFGANFSVANAVAYSGDKVIVAGRVGDAITGDFGLARYNADGSPDTGFGTGGLVTMNFSPLSDVPRDIGLQSDGRIIVGGLTNSEPAGDAIVARYTTDGTLDTTFGTGGTTVIDISGVGDAIRGLVVEPDDQIVGSGPAGADSALMRLNADGTLDTSFGSDGIVRTSAGIGDHFFNIARDADGRYVVVGTVDGDFLVSRYKTDGTPDTAFGDDGRVITPFETAESDLAMDVVVRDNGNIIAVGETGAVDDIGITTTRFALAQYTSDGGLAPGFGSGGTVTTDITSTLGAAADGIRGAVLQSDRLTVAGFCGESHGITNFLEPVVGDFCLARYDAGDGSLDTAFGGDGTVITDFTGKGDGARAIASKGGKVTVVGGAEGPPPGVDFALARYMSAP